MPVESKPLFHPEVTRNSGIRVKRLDTLPRKPTIVPRNKPMLFNHMREIDRKMSEIVDAESRRMFEELRLVTGIDPRHYADFSVLQFLQQCIYPNGHGKAVKIKRGCIAMVDQFDDFLLLRKPGKVGDGLNRLLRGLAVTLDNHSGTSIYMLLNQTLVPTRKRDHTRYFQ